MQQDVAIRNVVEAIYDIIAGNTQYQPAAKLAEYTDNFVFDGGDGKCSPSLRFELTNGQELVIGVVGANEIKGE